MEPPFCGCVGTFSPWPTRETPVALSQSHCGVAKVPGAFVSGDVAAADLPRVHGKPSEMVVLTVKSRPNTGNIMWHPSQNGELIYETCFF